MTHFSTQKSWHRHFCGLEKAGRDLVLAGASGSFFNHDSYTHNTVPGGQTQGPELGKSLHQQTEHNLSAGEENAIYDLLAQCDCLP